MAFASCDDDEQVLPKPTVEQIAEQIISLGAKEIDLHSERTGSYRNVPYEVKCPFVIITNDQGAKLYFPLDNLIEIWCPTIGGVVLYFE